MISRTWRLGLSLFSVVLVFVILSKGRSELVRVEVPSFTKHVRPFLSRYCYECHEPDNAKEGIDVTSYRKLVEGTGKKKKAVVVPGNPLLAPPGVAE